MAASIRVAASARCSAGTASGSAPVGRRAGEELGQVADHVVAGRAQVGDRRVDHLVTHA